MLPANRVPVELELNRPTLDRLREAVRKELLESNVPVKRTVLLEELVAAVTAWRFSTSPVRVVSEAAGAPPEPRARWEICLEPAIAPRADTRYWLNPKLVTWFGK